MLLHFKEKFIFEENPANEVEQEQPEQQIDSYRARADSESEHESSISSYQPSRHSERSLDLDSLAGTEISSKADSDLAKKSYFLYIVIPYEWKYCKLGVSCGKIESRYGTYYVEFFIKRYSIPSCEKLEQARKYEANLFDHFSKFMHSFYNIIILLCCLSVIHRGLSDAFYRRRRRRYFTSRSRAADARIKL